MPSTADLTRRNTAFAANGFDPCLTINPSGNMMVVGCVDPRVDPAHVLGLANGEAAIIRNVGGRITPTTLRTMSMLGKVGQANADTRVPGTWNLVILHHTDCGMTDLARYPELLAEYFEISQGELGGKSISDRGMVDYQNGHMSGADNNIEQLTGRRAMTVGEFACAHAGILNGVSSQLVSGAS